MLLKFPARYTNVPGNNVLFTVEVDRATCLSGGAISPALEQTFVDMEADGITLTILGIRLAAAMLFKTPGQPLSIADEQQAIVVLETWDFSAQKQPGAKHDRLVCKPPQNDSNRSKGTELLGVGIGLSIAMQVYGIPRNQWDITTNNARFDYTAVYPPTNGSVSVEVRARLDRNSWSKAVQKAADKLAQQAHDFTIAAAILVAPRSQMPLRALLTKDILIMDPVSNKPPQSPTQRLRNIVRHYIPFFERQEALNADNFTRRFAARLRELSEADEPAFQHYLCNGDAALQYDKRGLEKPWRTFFRYDGQRFCGVAMYGYALPMEIAGHKPIPGQGAFYFGLWEPVIEALRDGRIQDLVGMEVTAGSTQHGQSVFTLLEDGIAMVWTASEAELKPGMFDDLFPELENKDEQDTISMQAEDPTRNGTGEAVLAAAPNSVR